MEKGEIEILLIDDSPDDTDITLRTLKQFNLSNKVFTFKRADEALHFLLEKTSHKDPSSPPLLILLDLNMPGMGGLEFIQKVKSNEQTKNTPIATLTSTTELPDIKESLQMGVNYIAKPIEFEDLAEITSEMGFSLVLVDPAKKHAWVE